MSVISSVLSHHNRDLKWQTLKPSAHHRSWTDRVIALRQISVTAPCYSSILFRKWQENTSLRHEGMATQRCEEKRGRTRERAGERDLALWLLFLYVFPSPWACPMQIGLARSAVCSTWSPHSGSWTFLWLSFVLFSRAFPSLSFSHRHFGLLFPILTT